MHGASVPFVEAARLLVPQHGDRIDAGRAPSRNVGGHEHDGRERAGGGRERDRVCGIDAEQKASSRTREQDRSDSSEHGADGRYTSHMPQHQLTNPVGGRAEGET